ncbi:hypothetical protein M3Y94_00627400 [Aphelenchoides besseyi]|nr:hypothetical protein M3Y94_00627400 [Aphelenchoides besseyi]
MAQQMIFITLIVGALLIVAIAIGTFWFNPNCDLDDILLETLYTDQSLIAIVYVNVFGEMSWIYCVVVFRYLSKKVKHHWYASQTLSESYLIKEIGAVIDVLRPIMIAFAVLVISAGTTTSIQVYLHLFHEMPFCVGAMQVLANCGYLSLAVYNIFSALYLIFGFPSMRKSLIDDVQRLCGKRIENPRVGPQEINWSKEREDHFDYLDSIWK